MEFQAPAAAASAEKPLNYGLLIANILPVAAVVLLAAIAALLFILVLRTRKQPPNKPPTE